MYNQDQATVLTVFYDASCPLCSAEIHSLKHLDFDQLINLIDCSAADFDDTPYLSAGTNREAMMSSLHILDSNGQWHKGVASFELLYRTAGLPLIGTLWNHPVTRPFTIRLYPWVVRHRYTLSRFGLPRLMEGIGKLYALRAQRNASRCVSGQCNLPR